MHSLTLASPAKLNLVLRILGRRKDGYHELYTLFHRISLQDSLRLEKRSQGIRIICPDPPVPKRKNLIVRAFQLLKAHHPFSGGVTVYLTKRIPIGGGLGGGSSNAAAFLLTMNRLYRLGLGRSTLMKLGAELGADVPFFLAQVRQAIGTGKGERICPLPIRRRLWFLLFPSRRGLSTRKVYQSFRPALRPISLTRAKRDVRIALTFLEKGKPEEAARFLVNDLVASAEKIRPSLKKTRESVSGLHLGTCQMSGSGPTQFVIFTSISKARQALSRFRRPPLSKGVILSHSF